MIDIINHTPITCQAYSQLNQLHLPQTTLILKACYRFDHLGQLTLINKRPELNENNEFHQTHYQTPAESVYDIAPFKQGGEIIISGLVYPQQPASRHTDCRLSVQKPNKKIIIDKTLRIFGERHWLRSPVSYYISKPNMLKPLKLSYQYAYGGHDPLQRANIFSYNPLGCGFTETYHKIIDLRLPQIERASNLITRLADQPVPAGFGPLPFYWLAPHLMHARLKHLPDNYYNIAPRDQRYSNPWQGGEVVTLHGFLANTQTLTLQIPYQPFEIHYPKPCKLPMLAPSCDTIFIDTEQQQLILLWRQSFNRSQALPEKINISLAKPNDVAA